jgi:hypothetical protein
MFKTPEQQELEDWELARKLQEQWDKESSQPTQKDPQKLVITFLQSFKA